MNTIAVVMEAPRQLSLRALGLTAPTADDVVVEIDYSGISTGTERLLYTGTMPPFPGMGYPLVPGYESVGRVVDAGAGAQARIGERVFVPGANCFEGARGLFGGAARRVVIPAAKAAPVAASLGADAVLMALAATAQHALAGAAPADLPADLIVGHGVVGRLLARLTVAAGGAPTVWETNAARAHGGEGYAVVHPEADARRDYRRIVDASGDAGLLDTLIGRLAKGGEIVLAGFYSTPLSFSFPPAFMREARIGIAAEWQPADLDFVTAAVASGALSLAGLVTHQAPAADAPDAYRTAFGDAACLKMVLDWSGTA